MHHRIRTPGRTSLLFVAWLLLFSSFLAEAAAPLIISKAAYNKKTHTLNVTAKVNGASGSLSVLHDTGGILETRNVTPGKQSFAIPLPQNIPTPCNIEVRLGDVAIGKKVAGAPLACTKTPTCKILLPKAGIDVQANTPVNFKGLAKLKDKKAAPLKMEWDFAGGTMGEMITGSQPAAYKRPTGANTSVQFVRDNARYRVRFTAWDKQNRYCEASVLVNVGAPPTSAELPDVSALVKDAQMSAPAMGSQLEGKKDDVVVLPYPNLTLQNSMDARYTPNNVVVAAWGPFTSINAQVYRKDRLPLQLTDSEVKMQYLAASNPSDPSATNSINSTSQNWPLNTDIRKSAPFQAASVQKSDMWDTLARPSTDTLAADYGSNNWLAQVRWWTGYTGPLEYFITPDEGFNIWNPVNPWWSFTGGTGPSTPFPDDHGRYMPGRDQPFAENKAQDFTTYFNDARWHSARNIPVTDIDDAGRVNAFPLMKVTAVDKQTQQPLAAVDAVVATGKDFHCRECHAKGKIAANDQLDWSQFQAAYHSSPEYPTCDYRLTCSPTFSAPAFFDSVDRNGQPSNDPADQEYAAIKNTSSLHDFYDNTGLVDGMNFGFKDDSGYHYDWPGTCTACHQTMMQFEMGFNVNNSRGQKHGDDAFFPRYSQTMHKYHEQMQLDPGDKSKILRGSDGRPLRWDPSQGANPNSLFPTVNANGESLPQEQNCLRCHAGHREQLYRDRMYTAGVTCFDCHGDMMATGQAHNKPKPGPEGFTTRVEWYDQPDCGSCHTGNANQGNNGQSGFYSAGVLKRAFNSQDSSRTPLAPQSQRFAVQAGKPIDIFYSNWVDADYSTRNSIVNMTTPLYRTSKDKHGDVACGACHGGAHEVWPNRDPKANDNVTAMQLQGHTGTILECNVCHTADAFKNEADLDGSSSYSGDTKAGILGGPHNTHPVNDPFWWKSTNGDTVNADGTSYGGWHNNYAKKSGKDNEDQCAACHGNDHKGTRLSKTPVDRVFDFSGFDLKKLKKAGFKAKIIKVAAGTEIGCNTCHSIKTSCIGSPAGEQCGVASSTIPGTPNRDPVITSTPGTTTAIMGAAYSYQVSATDADGDALTFGLGTQPGNMGINALTGEVTSIWPMSTFSAYHQGPFTFPYTVNVKDGKGGYTTQTITMTLSCPAGQDWVWDGNAGKGECQMVSVGATITSQPAVSGLNAGGAYSYQVTATDANSLPLTYSLTGQPEGMTIAAESGLINWQTEVATSGTFHFKVTASDAGGGYGFQNVAVTVCKSPQIWHSDHGMCM